MFMFSLAIVSGLCLLLWSADKFVDGTASLAVHFGMPTLLIGILIVGFGTSTPEMAISIIATIDGTYPLAIGNALGSNIANIGLILGTTAIVSPIVAHSAIVKNNISLLLFVVLLIGYMLLDDTLSLIEGMVLFIGCIAFIGWSIYTAQQTKKDALVGDIKDEIKEVTIPLKESIFSLVLGFIFLIISSQILVWGAVGIAKALGVSDLIIGLTIIAIGTSLPELATSIMAVKKGEFDIVIGNIVGSNIFNILAVIGIATIMSPQQPLSSEIFYRDWSVMFILSTALFYIAHEEKEENKIDKPRGALLLIAYIAYNVYLGIALASS